MPKKKEMLIDVIRRLDVFPEKKVSLLRIDSLKCYATLRAARVTLIISECIIAPTTPEERHFIYRNRLFKYGVVRSRRRSSILLRFCRGRVLRLSILSSPRRGFNVVTMETSRFRKGETCKGCRPYARKYGEAAIVKTYARTPPAVHEAALIKLRNAIAILASDAPRAMTNDDWN